jgi:hypothetical protein
VALHKKPPICGNADDDQHQDCVTEPFEYFHEKAQGLVLFRVVKSQAADREIDHFMTVPRPRPG